MPRLIKSIDQIMHEQRRDVFVLVFENALFSHREDGQKSRRDHFEWLGTKNLSYETAAPRGWLEGDPGRYAIYFNGADDPRVAEYTEAFEGPTGVSLEPELYQMYLQTFQNWLNADGERHWAGEQDGSALD